MQRGNKECNWIEFTPGIVCEAAAGSGHFWIILKITLIAQIAAQHNWCFILLPSPVIAEIGADEDKQRSAEIYNSNYKPRECWDKI